VAVFFDGTRPVPAMLENLSATGALLTIPADRTARLDDIGLRIGLDSGRLAARAVRVEHASRRTRIALTFQYVDAHVRAVIDDAIDLSRAIAKRRPIIVLDDNETRRSILVDRLRGRGMSALAPTTPLDAFDELSRAHQKGCVCLLAPAFGQSAVGLRNVICETFPWAVTNMIGDEIDPTVDRALASWGDTDLAQLVRAFA
jgi:hypothetical protein